MTIHDQELGAFEHAAQLAVDLGNELAAEGDTADLWDVASGLLAGAVQFWLYSRQPCGDPTCESCAAVETAALRLDALIRETREAAEGSEYYHSPHDRDVGRA